MWPRRREADALRTAWEEWQALPEHERIQLNVVEPSRRSLLRCLLDYMTPYSSSIGDTLTVMLPEPAALAARTLAAQPKSPAIEGQVVLPARNCGDQRYLCQQTLPLRPKEIRHRFIVPIAELDRPSLQSLAYARSISPYVTAAHVAMDEQEVEEVSRSGSGCKSISRQKRRRTWS